MFRLSYQRPTDSKFTGPKTTSYTVAGWRPSQASSKVKDDRRTSRNTADDLGQPASETNGKSCKKFPKRPKTCFEAMGGHHEHSHCCLNDTICCIFAQTFLIALKLLSGSAVRVRLINASAHKRQQWTSHVQQPLAGVGVSSADVQFVQIHVVDRTGVGKEKCSTLLSSKIKSMEVTRMVAIVEAATARMSSVLSISERAH